MLPYTCGVRRGWCAPRISFLPGRVFMGVCRAGGHKDRGGRELGRKLSFVGMEAPGFGA